MKRAISILALTLVCLLVLAGCGCEHEWAAADCDTPKTCNLCAETEGEALGHTWADATCTVPKTCSACQETEGEALGHTWTDATTEAPKTCTVCAATEGERIITDPRFTTATASPILGSWSYVIPVTGEEMGIEGFEGQLDMRMSFDFGPAGDLEIIVGVEDEDAYMAAMRTILIDSLYAEFELQGMNKEEADAAMVATYGLTMEQFADVSLATVDASQLEQTLTFVYYVEDDQIYVGLSWDATVMEPTAFTVEGDTLTMYEDIVYGTGETLVLTRDAE